MTLWSLLSNQSQIVVNNISACLFLITDCAALDEMGMMNRSHFSSRLLPYTVTTAGKETVVNSSLFMSSGDAIKSSIRITISVFLVTAAIFGLVGSVLVLYFMKTKKVTNSFLRGISLQKNFNFYIKSLATSDILSSLISVPVTVISLLSDSHSIQSGWGCKATM